MKLNFAVVRLHIGKLVITVKNELLSSYNNVDWAHGLMCRLIPCSFFAWIGEIAQNLVSYIQLLQPINYLNFVAILCRNSRLMVDEDDFK